VSQYAKAIAALVVSFLATYLARVGVDLDASQTDVLVSVFGALVTALLTWAIPNTPKPVED
jgi:uncharacterized membrane protein (DUF441 family)